MKLFAFLMAVVVLTLSMLPCSDAGAALKGDLKAEVKSVPHRDNDANDECTPFCHCTCCAGFSINHFPAALEIATQYQEKPKACFLLSNIFELSLPVWQPPQLLA